MKRITELSHVDARSFFLKAESYVKFDLPQYFTFQKLINKIDKKLSGKDLVTFQSTNKLLRPGNLENVNYMFLNNKDGRYAWRPLQLIHPAIYVSLVHKITDQTNWNIIVQRFKDFIKNKKIRCCSVPIQSESKRSDKAETVTQWWHAIEQQSLSLALKYKYVLHTDITDCYGSIYTHSIPWAIHTKPFIKRKENINDSSLVGNIIDKHLRDMAYNQTNGIPQGSVLMDFIAEIVLGYADEQLSLRIKAAKVIDYEILRYRDDYRIFVNNPQDAELIAKLLTEVLIDLGMRLNTQKTLATDKVIRDSIKPDKLYWITAKRKNWNIQQHLLLIHVLSDKYPNSGTLEKALVKFHKRIKKINKLNEDIEVLISVLIDIMYNNPRTYPITSAILSKLLSLLNSKPAQKRILRLTRKRFNTIPNTGHIKIWLQRLTIKLKRDIVYEEDLCEKVNDSSITIWNSDWLNKSLKDIIEKTPIIDEGIINDIDVVIASDEVELFKSAYDS